MRHQAKSLQLFVWAYIGLVFVCILTLFFFLWSNQNPPTEPTLATQSTTLPSSDGKDMIFYFKRNDNMEIALTFDDGPHPRYTPQILDILDEYGIKATFFMIGENIKYYPNAAREVLSRGHEIGNHTYHHKTLKPLCDNDILQEVESCEHELSGLGAPHTLLLRPPEGSMNEQVRRVVGDLDYRIILWDLDTKDWAHTPPQEISRHILSDIEAGDIILMHDFIGHNSPTPEALRLFIPELLSRGYKFVTVSQLLDEGHEGDEEYEEYEGETS